MKQHKPQRTPTGSTPVKDLYNLSDLTGSWLNEIGIYTFDDLQRADLFEVWTILKSEHSQVTRLMYYAMWGAVENAHWNTMPESEKAAFQKKLDSFTAFQ